MPLRDEGGCLRRDEWFLPGTQSRAVGGVSPNDGIRLRRPTPGLKLAFDPRLPASAQAFDFELAGVAPGDRVVWTVDGREQEHAGATLRWTVTRGEHRVAARVLRDASLVAALGETAFVVK